jgi:sec-independent protein translocase protein TatA
MHYFLFLEFIGTSELMVILVVALIIFGPRKLPELGRSLGQAMHQLRGASEDFKRTWEAEARLETEGVAALTLAPATSAGQVEAAVEAPAVEETHAPPQEVQTPGGLTYAGSETTYVEA